MTREEQIYENALLWDGRDYEMFIEGANWADENPAWHKYPDEKPTEPKDYIIAFEDGMAISSYSVRRECFNIFCDGIIAWMEKPQPPKF